MKLYSGAPLRGNFGILSIQEILVVTSAYTPALPPVQTLGEGQGSPNTTRREGGGWECHFSWREIARCFRATGVLLGNPISIGKLHLINSEINWERAGSVYPLIQVLKEVDDLLTIDTNGKKSSRSGEHASRKKIIKNACRMIRFFKREARMKIAICRLQFHSSTENTLPEAGNANEHSRNWKCQQKHWYFRLPKTALFVLASKNF